MIYHQISIFSTSGGGGGQGNLGTFFYRAAPLREGFKNQINYFRGIFHEGEGGYPPSVKIINFFTPKK